MAAMACAHGHAIDPVMKGHQSARAALRAEFFQSVRLIVAAANEGRGGAFGIGGDTRPEEEPLRVSAAMGLHHPDAEIMTLSQEKADRPVVMDIAFMGLTGPSGALPDHYSDHVVAGRRSRDEGLTRFLDLFNHRIVSHFYRAWAKYRLPVRFGETAGDLSDPFSAALAAVAGIARREDDPRLLEVAGPLSRRIRSASALKRIVTALFDVDVEIIELEPRWISIADAEQTRLGSNAKPEGQYARLGETAVVGASTIDLAGRFRMRIGPLDMKRFRTFFQEDGIRERMIETVRFAVGPNVDFELQLVLKKEAVPKICLGTTPVALGHDGWLLSGEAVKDRADAVLSSRRREAY